MSVFKRKVPTDKTTRFPFKFKMGDRVIVSGIKDSPTMVVTRAVAPNDKDVMGNVADRAYYCVVGFDLDNAPFNITLYESLLELSK